MRTGLVAVVALGWAHPALAQGASVYLTEQSTAFEDGVDDDYNDVSVRWSKKCRFDANGALVADEVRFAVVAAGAAWPDGLWLVPPGTPAAAVITRGADAPVPLGWGPDLRLELYSAIDAAFGAPPTGPFVNTVPGDPIVPGRTTVLETTYATPLPVSLACAPPAFEIATPDGIVSATSVDPGTLRPLSGRFDGWFQPPTEKASIVDAYPGFVAWAADLADDGVCDTACAGTMWFDAPTAGLVLVRDDLDTTAALGVFATCSDGVQNQDEVTVDCGGAGCPSCGAGVPLVSNASSPGNNASILGVERFGQPFVPPHGTHLTDVSVTLSRNGVAAGTAVYVAVYDAPGGKPADGAAPIAVSATVPHGDLAQYPATAAVSFPFSTRPLLLPGHTYAWVVQVTAPPAPFRVDVWFGNGDPIPGIARVLTVDGGATWISAGNGGDHVGWTVYGDP